MNTFSIDNTHLHLIDTSKSYKPLDFSGGGITGSVHHDGRFVSVNLYHPQHGYATLNALEPFGDDGRFDADAVRDYRDSLLTTEGFGLHIQEPTIRQDTFLIEFAIPYTRFHFADDRWAEVITFAPETTPGVVQIWRFSDPSITVLWSGHMRLQRSAYTQITEGGIIDAPSARTTIALQSTVFTILENRALPQAAATNGGLCEASPNGSVILKESASLGRLSYLDDNAVALYFAFGEDKASAQTAFDTLVERGAEMLLEETLAVWQDRWSDWPYADRFEDPMLRRAVVYALLCCVPVTEDATCIMTDHQLLPLSWNRDSYYQAMALLHWRPEMHQHVRRHLIWQFEVTEQPDGCWRRSYFVNGKVKDMAYQLDQHIFPFLELLDYIEVNCDTALLSRLQDSVEASLQGLLAREEDGSGLFATEESPADDALPLPYHFSSHVLMWYTLRRLAVLLQRPELQIVADRVHAAVYRHFPTTFEGKTLFAYVTDAHGEHMLYQDANDYPTALAPYWGFCTADDPIWQATIDFAFSAKNARGYAPGSFNALGSIHTPGGWPLGNVQEYIVARIQGEQAHADAIMQCQVAVSQCDSSLPETYDPESGQAYARHWFSWPEASTFHYLRLFEGQ